MSKSLGNAIGIKDPAPDMYGKLMSISDELMWRYWTFLTDKKQSEIDAMRSRVTGGELHPMQAKKDLAHAITTDFHSTDAADAAAQSWATQFQQKGVAEDLPEVTVSKGEALDGLPYIVRSTKLLHLCGLAASMGEATRKMKENAVSLNGTKLSSMVCQMSKDDPDDYPVLGDSPILRLGKRQVKINWKA
jgi:tyrosyl-tRNA synthetase